ncbi:GbsR/MarR family transcriptional regulator [Blastococcus sp. VKM Ac-2987]|uniref:GbsR/MarR family transcriptional regulator n=1 Tax=Blastococcus sp. VKM Ac-2987 TaxID=3004141 RepID=UPI0022ABA7BC|nr:helix-turn-helix domain-containing protein [Blastococcus sp. VKM Ac-2987]MCZ2858917.1 helix-turn-helix domain-containing protein [Blastococcus sp. VKM Ac-2987]
MTTVDGEEIQRAALLRFVERFALVLRESGMSPMPARVLAYALADDADRYTATDLAAGLQVSPAAISGAVRQLVQVGLLVREREPGTRSDLYVLDDTDLWSRFMASELAALQRFEDAVAAGVEGLGVDRPGGRRLAETRDFMAFLHAELADAVARWPAERARRAADRQADREADREAG